MNPEDRKLLEAALALIGTISVIGREKIDTKLEQLNPRELQQVLDLAKGAEVPTRLLSWNEAVRAWVIAKIAMTFITRYGWSEPERPKLLACLRALPRSEPEVRRDLARLVTGAEVLRQLVEHQNSASRNAWQPGPFTDPASHDPKKFCYLISALRPSTGLGFASADQKDRYEYMGEKLKGYVDVGEDRAWLLRSAELYLKNPNTVLGDVTCCSLIDQSHTATYGKFSFGFIFSVPKQNICSASDGDIASSINSVARADMLKLCSTPVARAVQVDNFLEQLRDMYAGKLQAPQQIIAASKKRNVHNEVIVLGSLPTGSVRITGIFLKVSRTNKLLATFVAEDKQFGLRKLILDCRDALGIPIITIPSDADASDVDLAVWAKGEVGSVSSGKPTGPSASGLGSPPPIGGPVAAPVAPPIVLRPGDLVRFLQRVSPDRYCVARVLDAATPPLWQGVNQWPGNRPTVATPGTPAVYSSRPQWANAPIQYVWVQAVRYEPADAPSEVGYFYEPDVGSLTPVAM